jgi:type VII secretion-associated serine protease mycosin
MTSRSLGAAAAVLAALTAVVVLPAAPASAGPPAPRSQEWQFTAWDIQNKVWPLTHGEGVTVAVIDTGVQADLPGLAGVVLPGTDLDSGKGDGRVDTDQEEGRGHGTAMAELIAGQGKDFGMVGIAPGARILPITASQDPNNIGAAIVYAADHGAKVINISESDVDGSLGMPCRNEVRSAIVHAAAKDAVIVASAGNEGDGINSRTWPADCPGVLAVGAIDGKKIPWTSTQRQPYVSVAAPGVQIWSVWEGHHGWTDRRFAAGNGTSQASALTSGAVALIRAKNPGLTARQVVQRIINTASDAGPTGFDVYTGNGAVIPYRAMTQSVPANAPNKPYEALDSYLASLSPSPAPVATGTTHAAKHLPAPVLSIAVGAVAVLMLGGIVTGIVLLARRKNGQPPRPGPPPAFGPPMAAPSMAGPSMAGPPPSGPPMAGPPLSGRPGAGVPLGQPPSGPPTPGPFVLGQPGPNQPVPGQPAPGAPGPGPAAFLPRVPPNEPGGQR